MTQWQIDPAGVQGVLERARVAQEELGTALDPGSFDAPVAALSWCPELTGGIPEALGLVLESRLGEFKAIVNHVSAGIVGVTAASNTYLDAQTEMDASVRATQASQVEEEMMRAAETGNFSFFEKMATGESS
ncbi:hypothetical protein EII34_07925 [Arachnia propionica]|uniref:Excreted virulence factor EspC (Type VII ESX diderm) n=1 Tax=Arachnia propionica TaxID=1750 RepID=A0A3P1T7D9_9ACTN|nr:DUF6507 family protein [Arachnia propionica]RRD05250.1 hypothetical protein EII34_07925 [Arachnia propionica]